MQLSTFVGRDRELAHLGVLCGRERIVTVTGPGGAGKTRLAIEVAARAGDSVFVDLAPLTEPTLVAAAIASAAGVREHPPEDSLVSSLRDRSLLVVLDNCEHLVAGVRGLATRLLIACPGVRILATSRRPLDIAGESVWPIPPMDMQDAVGLFCERARFARPTFEHRAAVDDLCARLEGMPLAIELAAARTRVLAVEQIAERLGDRLALLAGGRPSPPRHETLRAAIAWGWDLLSPAERTLLARTSAFSGSFDIAAIEAICAGGTIAQCDVLDLVASLAEQSFLVVEDHGPQLRYRLLEAIRAFACEQLDEQAVWRRRHAEHFQRRAETNRRDETALEKDLDQFRGAIAWSLDGDPDTAAKLSVDLILMLSNRGLALEALTYTQQALRRDLSPPLRVATLNAAANMLMETGDLDDAWRTLSECLELRRAEGNALLLASTICDLGVLAYRRGDLPAAVRCYEEALAISREVPDRQQTAVLLLNLGGVLLELDRLDEARSSLEEALEVTRGEGGSPSFDASCTLNLAEIAIREGDAARALSSFREALGTFDRERFHPGIIEAIDGIAACMHALGDHDRATLLLSAGASERERIGKPRIPRFAAEAGRLLDGSRTALGPEAFDATVAQGRAMPLEEVVAVALSGGGGPGGGGPGRPGGARPRGGPPPRDRVLPSRGRRLGGRLRRHAGAHPRREGHAVHRPAAGPPRTRVPRCRPHRAHRRTPPGRAADG